MNVCLLPESVAWDWGEAGAPSSNFLPLQSLAFSLALAASIARSGSCVIELLEPSWLAGHWLNINFGPG